MVIGIDVAADRLNCVALDDHGAFAGGRLLGSPDLDVLCEWAQPAEVIAIDAPAALSTGHHASDDHLSPKFRTARCGEIALARDHGIWVPWTTPTARPVAGWMETGFAVWDALAGLAGALLLEVYPHGAFRSLLERQHLAKKTSVAGARQRLSALRAAGVEAANAELWSHDSLDAAVAAVVALHRRRGSAVEATCGHDGSAIWLPATGAPRAMVR